MLRNTNGAGHFRRTTAIISLLMVSGMECRGRHGARCLFLGVRNRLGFLERKFRGMHTARQVWNGIDPEENFTAEAADMCRESEIRFSSGVQARAV